MSLGLVRREPRAGRREVGLHVTAAGARRLQIALRARADAVQALVAPLPPAERRQLAELTGKALRGGTRRRDEADIACRLRLGGLRAGLPGRRLGGASGAAAAVIVACTAAPRDH